MNTLVDVLFEKEYFAFKEDSMVYVGKLIEYIEINIDRIQPKITPKKIKSKGNYYLNYQPNKKTTWYVLFERRERQYLVTYIFNNHCKEAKYL